MPSKPEGMPSRSLESLLLLISNLSPLPPLPDLSERGEGEGERQREKVWGRQRGERERGGYRKTEREAGGGVGGQVCIVQHTRGSKLSLMTTYKAVRDPRATRPSGNAFKYGYNRYEVQGKFGRSRLVKQGRHEAVLPSLARACLSAKGSWHVRRVPTGMRAAAAWTQVERDQPVSQRRELPDTYLKNTMLVCGYPKKIAEHEHHHNG